MATTLLNGKQQFLDRAGVALALGTVELYVPSTTTPKASWQDAGGTISNTNPITLDAAGYAIIYGTGSYRQIVKDALGNVIWDQVAASAGSDLTASSGSSLMGFIQAGAGAVAQTAQSKMRQTFTAQDFGAVGDGVTSDVAALTTTGSKMTLPAGTYYIDANLTLSADITMMPGASFSIKTGVTLTLTGSLIAPIARIFSGLGTVNMISSRIPVAYAEWWGAVGNDSGTDSLAALTAASIAHHVVQLLAADYYTSGEWSIKLPYRGVKGMGCQYNGAVNQVTRVIVASATAFVVRFGPDTYPGLINALQQGNFIENVQLTRSIAPLIGSVGLKVQWTLYTRVNNVKAAENNAGFLFFGTVGTYANDCYAFWTQSVADTGLTVRGFIVDGNSTISTVNGNASIYLTRCNATIGGLPVVNSQGFYIDNKMTDCILLQPETQNMNSGIALIGDNGAGAIGTNAHVQVLGGTFDGCTGIGVYCQNLNKWGRITFENTYVALAGATATDGIYATNCLGSLLFQGGEVYMANIGSSGFGMTIINSRGVIVDNTLVSECRGRALRLSGSGACNIRPAIQNEQATTVTTLPAVTVTTSSRNYLQPSYKGVANGCAIGVNITDATSAYNEINCSMMDPAGITGGSANKLVINGTQVTAVGIAAAGSGNNLASGIMA